MIMLPVWAAFLVLGLLPLLGLGCYVYGWWLRGKTDWSIRHEASVRAMTAEERRHFDRAFEHMDKAFDEMGKIFK